MRTIRSTRSPPPAITRSRPPLNFGGRDLSGYAAVGDACHGAATGGGGSPSLEVDGPTDNGCSRTVRDAFKAVGVSEEETNRLSLKAQQRQIWQQQNDADRSRPDKAAATAHLRLQQQEQAGASAPAGGDQGPDHGDSAANSERRRQETAVPDTRPAPDPRATVAGTASDIAPVGPEDELSSVDQFVGVDLLGCFMGGTPSWEKNVKERQCHFQHLLEDLVSYAKEDGVKGESMVGMKKFRVVSETGEYHEKAVLNLYCEVDLREDLTARHARRVKEICKNLAQLLREAGAAEEHLKHLMIGTLWQCKIKMPEEDPTSVADVHLFCPEQANLDYCDEFSRMQQRAQGDSGSSVTTTNRKDMIHDYGQINFDKFLRGRIGSN
mmetsp:Transcript_34426/g.75355  ORF Transcript_34426/g.75355 Transcript_34426/m.75355 type:complete len:381 (-) Transcript_34426:323-1465(-)